ncbi:LysM peptidoglycan-binding domain-containing protein [Planctomycetaceae bacterium]|jgi:LysM repeat protein|nr:LysM peptidoglycan-binding domain-containing protein [Planctomycetaceae bacterium]
MLRVSVIASLLAMLTGCRLEIPEETPPAPSTESEPTQSLPIPSTSNEPLVVSPKEVLKHIPSPQEDHYHQVQKGETLGSIAELYGTTAEKLAQVNGLGAPNDLKPGQRIYIPFIDPLKPVK